MNKFSFKKKGGVLNNWGNGNNAINSHSNRSGNSHNNNNSNKKVSILKNIFEITDRKRC